jgi:hypothetical protein
MSKLEPSDRLGNLETEEERIETRRRRLLRAAAAAPLVATLHSGSAGANASASQCVIRSENASKGNDDVAAPSAYIPAGNPDIWVRRQVMSVLCQDNRETPNFFLAFNIDGVWRRDSDGEVVNPVFTAPGDPPCDPNSNTCVFGEPQNVLALEIYRPELADSNFAPIGVDSVGTYPQYDLALRRPSASMDNMGITTTCLCSVDPGLAPDA